MKGAGGVVLQTKELRDLDLSTWLTNHSGLSEVRDVREGMTLAMIFDSIQKKDLARAADILVMRIQALQKAKAKGGKWESASKIELLPDSAQEVGPAGLASVTS